MKESGFLFAQKTIFIGVLLFIAGMLFMERDNFSRSAYLFLMVIPSLYILLGDSGALPSWKKSFFYNRHLIFLVAFFLYCFITVFWSGLPSRVKWSVFNDALYPVFFVFAVYIFTLDQKLKDVLPYFFVILTTISLVVAMVVWQEDSGRLQGYGQIVNNSQAALFYATASILAMHFSLQSSSQPLTIIWLSFAVFLLVGNVLTVSRMPMLINAAFFAFYFFAFLKLKSLRFGGFTLLVIVVSAVLVFMFFPDKWLVLAEKGLESARYQIWGAAIDVFFDNPIWGQGIGVPEAVSIQLGNRIMDWHAHNLLLDYGIHVGLVGLVWMVWLIIAAIKNGYKNPANQPWLIIFVVYLLFSLTGGRVIVDRIEPEWVVFLMPWAVLLSSSVQDPRKRAENNQTTHSTTV